MGLICWCRSPLCHPLWPGSFVACTHDTALSYMQKGWQTELLAKPVKPAVLLFAFLLKPPLHQRSFLLVCLCGAWSHYLFCAVAQLLPLAQRHLAKLWLWKAIQRAVYPDSDPNNRSVLNFNWIRQIQLELQLCTLHNFSQVGVQSANLCPCI